MIQFVFRNRLWILFTAAFVVLLLAVFRSESNEPGAMQKYYELPITQLEKIEYAGTMNLTEKEQAQVHYTVIREENILQPKEPLYRIEIKNISSENKNLKTYVANLQTVKNFYASPLIKTIAQDWSTLDYLYELEHDAKRDEEYGFKNCTNKLTLIFRTQTRIFCIGLASQSDTRRYIFDQSKNKTLIIPDFIARRIQNNIFAQRENSLYPHGVHGIDTIEWSIGKDLIAKFPTLKEKTTGRIALRKMVKEEGKKKIDVWYVENHLGIKPSHAAEAMQFITALRIQKLFATNVQPHDKPLTDFFAALGFTPSAIPAMTGVIKLKKADKQDIILTPFSFFSPNVRPQRTPAFQLENERALSQESIAVSQYNAGYLSADMYPRLTAILTKFEGDLLAEKEKKIGIEKKNKKPK
ncbi:MAG TPA: hypothetical protein PLY93_01255 [Turneriella sp.]|nr:hypothetical protein [Turneriella sp.]